jgi:ATP-binding cassette subfamily B protein
MSNPPVLIFDDSTSSVDAGTDARIRMALDKASEGRTTIIIAHRLSSLQHADEILVLDNGRIVERGDHDDLLALNGRYRELFDLQQTQAVEVDE